MSQLESLIATAGEGPLGSELTYALAPANTTVVDRKTHVRAYPTSASTLSPTGTKTCRLRLGGDDFVDASSVRLQFTINNLDGSNKLVPTTGGWGCIQQLFLRSGGTELSNIQYYNRFHTQFLFNQITQAEQWGVTGITGGMSAVPTSTGAFRPKPGTIPANGSLTVMFPLAVGMLQSQKILPTRYAPLELEFSVISDVTDWLDTTTGNSTSFNISNAQILYDAVTLDEAVNASFYKLLVSGRLLTLPLMEASQTVYSIPAGSTSFQFSTVRAYSRLAQIWLTFRKSGPRSSQFLPHGDLPGSAGATDLNDGTCPTARLFIGPHCWPMPMPIASTAEYFHQFQSSLGNVPNIHRTDFETNSFTICFDLKKLPSDITSSLSTRSGDQCLIQLTNMVADQVNEVWCTLMSFNVCAIRESGVTLLT
jgi:hypothetical protein